MKKIMELLQNMKAKNEKKDNKGFSLVELIIVIAIMAILVGIVGTQVIPYINKSKEAKDLQMLCREYNVPFIINDNVDIALAMDADGVHVGQSDMEAGDVRAKLGPDKIIGVSAQTVEQAILAEKHGADYLGVGAVFPTGSKDDATEVPHETLKAICEAVSIPVIAIGGITQENVSTLAGSGICGIAVISAIYAQPDIRKAAQDLKTATTEMVKA